MVELASYVVLSSYTFCPHLTVLILAYESWISAQDGTEKTLEESLDEDKPVARSSIVLIIRADGNVQLSALSSKLAS